MPPCTRFWVGRNYVQDFELAATMCKILILSKVGELLVGVAQLRKQNMKFMLICMKINHVDVRIHHVAWPLLFTFSILLFISSIFLWKINKSVKVNRFCFVLLFGSTTSLAYTLMLIYKFIWSRATFINLLVLYYEIENKKMK